MRLTRQTGSPYWYADFEVWNEARGKLVRTLKSTKKTDEGEARKVAEQFVQVAGGVVEEYKRGVLTRRTIEGFIGGVLRSSGQQASYTAMPSWKEFAARWLASRKIGADTREGYQTNLDHFARFLGSRVHDPLPVVLTVTVVQGFLDWMAGEFAPATVKARMKFFRILAKRAVAEGWMERTPFDLVELIVKPSPPRRAFDLVEFEQLIRWLRTDPTPVMREWETMVWLGLCTTARLGDCAMMSTDHLDLSSMTLTWRPIKNNTIRSEKVMSVPVAEPLKSHLQRLLEAGRKGLFCPLLAAKMKGDARYTSVLSTEFGVFLRRAKIGQEIRSARNRKLRGLSFHCLRHTLTTWMATAGVSEARRMTITGHTSMAVHKKYTHVELAAMTEALDLGLSRVKALGLYGTSKKQRGARHSKAATIPV